MYASAPTGKQRLVILGALRKEKTLGGIPPRMTRVDPASILIVDDEPKNRKLLETLLRAEGYVTTSATNGEEALAEVANAPPDLILLDIMMPGMDGYQVAKILKGKSASAHIPIIMVTALADRNARLAGLNAGAEEFLTKPVDRTELWLRVRNLLRLKAYGDFLRNHGEILARAVQARTAELETFRTAMDALGGGDSPGEPLHPFRRR